MLHVARKYLVVFQVAISERLIYRADFFISTFLMFIPIITTVLLWRAIYEGAGRSEVGGLAYTQMVSYYLFVMVARAFGSMPGLSSEIATDIRDGGLRKYLLQPISYLGYLITLRIAHKMTYFLMAFVPYAIVFWMCRSFLPGWPEPGRLALSIVSLLLAFGLGFAINCLLGMLGFWFLEVRSLVGVFLTAQYFLSGHMFPLSLLPTTLDRIITWMPFAYETYYPSMILLQKLEPSETMRVLLIQAVWIVLLGCIIRLAWQRGLKHYAAYGG